MVKPMTPSCMVIRDEQQLANASDANIASGANHIKRISSTRILGRWDPPLPAVMNHELQAVIKP